MVNLTEKETRPLATIREVGNKKPIENADLIEVVKIDGWEVVTKKNEFKTGDKVVYIEIDSILPELEMFEFMRPREFRVKTIKLRGQFSQGIVFPLSILEEFDTKNLNLELNTDVTKILGIKKYIGNMDFQQTNAKGNFPYFIPKTDETRLQNVMQILDKEVKENIYITEKVDGSSITIFYNKGNFGVCSRNLELKLEEGGKFTIPVFENKIEEKLTAYCVENNVNLALQGELLGVGVKGNKYKLKGLEIRFFNVFNVDTQKFLNFDEFLGVISDLDLKAVPLILVPEDFEFTKEYLINLSKRQSVLYKNVKAEGIIIRSKEERNDIRGTNENRYSFKVINPEFLLKYE